MVEVRHTGREKYSSITSLTTLKKAELLKSSSISLSCNNKIDFEMNPRLVLYNYHLNLSLPLNRGDQSRVRKLRLDLP